MMFRWFSGMQDAYAWHDVHVWYSQVNTFTSKYMRTKIHEEWMIEPNEGKKKKGMNDWMNERKYMNKDQ